MATSSQGNSFPSVSGATNIKVKKSRQDPMAARLDASTLSLQDGSTRVYEDGLPDGGADSVDGITTTANVSFLSDSPPEIGSEITLDGVTLRCSDTEIEYAVGELVKGTATFISVPPEL